MRADEERTIEIKLRAVAAEAESLAEDIKNRKLWEGDCARRLAVISENLRAAQNAARFDLP